MSQLPATARWFIIAVCLAGALTVLQARTLAAPFSLVQAWEFILLLGLGILAGRKKVRLLQGEGTEDGGSMSLGFVITFAAILRCGPAAGLLIGVVSSRAGCLRPARMPVHQLLFTTSLAAVQTWLAGLVFLALNGWSLKLDPLRSLPAVTSACLVYFLTNSVGVAGVLGLCKGQNIARLWRQNFLWTAPSYFAGASISTLALVIFGPHVAALFLCGAPVAYLTYQSYSTYVARTEEKQKHIEELQSSQNRLADLYLATIKSLALAIDAKDQYTHEHILRVQRYAVATAEKLGLKGPALEGLKTGALLHDIGKLGVPEYVLLKPGKLTDEEFSKIQKHPLIGAAILDHVAFPWPVLPVVKYHHERWDGKGYPEGLRGTAIPLTARILAVADVYDALTSTRSYRNAWSHERAVEEIRKGAGTQFDPEVVQAFVEVIDGVVAEMARDGQGPLVGFASAARPAATKADQAVRDIQRASSELWALYEVSQTLSSSLGLQDTLEILSRKLELILPGTACVFLLKDAESDALIVRAAVGVNQEHFSGSRTINPASRSAVAARTCSTYVGEYDPDDLFIQTSKTSAWTRLRSALIVPIVHQGEPLGTINVYHAEADAFGPHDRQLLETIAERAAMALYNGILFDRTRSQSLTDPLTGLHNVRYLTQYVENRCREALANAAPGATGESGAGEAVEVRKADRFALLCLDLDYFKPINDNFGHQKGDRVLRELSRVFRSAVRQGDVVARYGGDEFLIVLQQADRLEADAMARRLVEAVERYDPGLVHPKLGALRLGVSVGVACFPEDGHDSASLLSKADSGMYSTKTERKLGKLAEAQRATPEAGLPRAA